MLEVQSETINARGLYTWDTVSRPRRCRPTTW